MPYVQSFLEISRERRLQRLRRKAAASQAKADAVVADVEESEAAIEACEGVTPKRRTLVATHGRAWRRFVLELNKGRKREVVCPDYGPTTADVARYATYMFKRRVNYSTAGKTGLSNSYKHQVTTPRRRDSHGE